MRESFFPTVTGERRKEEINDNVMSTFSMEKVRIKENSVGNIYVCIHALEYVLKHVYTYLILQNTRESYYYFL